MSIASKVINTNTALATLRVNLKTLLENHGIVYYSDDDIFTLARRVWFLIYPVNNGNSISYDTNASVGNPIDFSVDMKSSNGEILPDGAVADFYITSNGEETHLITLSENGYAKCTYIPETAGETITVKVKVNDWQCGEKNFYVYAFRYEDEWSVNPDSYTLVKYPTSASITVSEVDEFNSQYSYANGVEVSKTYGSAQAAYMIPTSFLDGVDLSETGIHFQAIVSPMYSSASGWASGICLLSSKDLNHYRDTAILELGAYPGKKGLKYSGSNHAITEINVTSGQLTINNAFMFNLWYDGTYVKATIQDYGESTTYYSYETSSLPSEVTNLERVFPAFMIYDYGGKIRFRETKIEIWSKEDD